MKKYKCNDCGSTIIIAKQPIPNEDGTYTFDYPTPRFCGVCGAMSPYHLGVLENLFAIYGLNERLDRARNLMMKSEYEAACRECFVVLENTIKSESGINNAHGSTLVNQAFSMTYDKASGTITVFPRIAINSLTTESERNEQDGIKHMLTGFFRGPRNIYQHNRVKVGFGASFAILIQTSFFLDLIIKRHSLLSKPKWIRHSFSTEEIYNKMPKLRDRVFYKLDCSIKRFGASGKKKL